MVHIPCPCVRPQGTKTRNSPYDTTLQETTHLGATTTVWVLVLVVRGHEKTLTHMGEGNTRKEKGTTNDQDQQQAKKPPTNRAGPVYEA